MARLAGDAMFTKQPSNMAVFLNNAQTPRISSCAQIRSALYLADASSTRAAERLFAASFPAALDQPFVFLLSER